MTPLLEIRNLTVEFPASAGRKVHAVNDLSFTVEAGETLGLVGESGCGKSTTGRSILQLPPPTSGEVFFEGDDLTKRSAAQLRRIRPRMQMIFQDPIASLNPRRKVQDIIAEPMATWSRGTAAERQEKVRSLMASVGLDYEKVGRRRRGSFSGGQCQRISIARALSLEPKLLICDEPVSALDVSVQAQILNLLEDMKRRYDLTLIFIAHDLGVVKRISDRVAVMYLGTLCELAAADELYAAPRHPYTAGLLASIPSVATAGAEVDEEPALAGEVPSAIDPPSGCPFRTRCPRADELCARERPTVRELSPGHLVACHHPLPVEMPGGLARDARSTRTAAANGS